MSTEHVSIIYLSIIYHLSFYPTSPVMYGPTYMHSSQTFRLLCGILITRAQYTWVRVQVLKTISSVTLNKLHNTSVPPFGFFFLICKMGSVRVLI